MVAVATPGQLVCLQAAPLPGASCPAGPSLLVLALAMSGVYGAAARKLRPCDRPQAR
jgi:hypothetical protein